MVKKKYGIAYRNIWQDNFTILPKYFYNTKEDANKDCEKFNAISDFFKHKVVEINVV